jgi:hypothetical protein
MEKIRTNQFMDLKELLNGNVILLGHIQTTGTPQSYSLSCLCKIGDPISWMYCFPCVLAASTEDTQVHSLIAYSQNILSLAQRFWLACL